MESGGSQQNPPPETKNDIDLHHPQLITIGFAGAIQALGRSKT
jgi:hypothetical protein